jgi:hypothetical protein
MHSFLAAISIYGLESFMLVKGAVKQHTWCYFITEAAKNFYEKYEKDIEKFEDIILLYDNA